MKTPRTLKELRKALPKWIITYRYAVNPETSPAAGHRLLMSDIVGFPFRTYGFREFSRLAVIAAAYGAGMAFEQEQKEKKEGR